MTNDIEIISKKEAKERGLKRYFTGKPCKHEHIAERLVSNGTCCECRAEHRNKNKDKIARRDKEYRNKNKDKVTEYQREWRAKNKDKIAERKMEYRKQNKDKITEYAKEWYTKNEDKIKEQRKEYYNKNKDKIAEHHREHRKQNKDKIAEYKREHYKQNKDKIAEYHREWCKQNPAQYFLRGSLNRIFTNWKGSRKKMEKLHGYTFEQLVTRIEFQFKDGMSWDNRSEWHVDHKKPIARFLEQGITDPAIINALSNLQPLWAHENLSKGAKFEL